MFWNRHYMFVFYEDQMASFLSCNLKTSTCEGFYNFTPRE